MKLSTFKYHLGQGFRGMFKNGFMSLAAVATVAACSFILILSLCIGMNIDYILQQFEETIGITVFLGPDVDEEMAMDIQDRILAIDHVSEVVYKTSEENLDDALSTWENASILEGLRADNPLPASFEISLDGAAYQEEVVKQLETLQVSVEAELNGTINADDYVDRVYLDENGNEITRKQAIELGIIEPEEGEEVETSSAAETETAAVTEATTTPVEPATEIITSAAQTDAEVKPSEEAAETAPAGEAPAETPAAADESVAAQAPAAESGSVDNQSAAVTESAETDITEEETETTTYSTAPSSAFLETLSNAVAATAGGRVYIDGSYYSNTVTNNEDYGVAGVELYDASEYGGIEYQYRGIEKIRHATEEANILVRINTAVRIFSLIVVIILCVISVSIIMNTIRLTVVIRKNEINIMKYVGATDWFIRWPFIIEGMLIGFIGSVVPTVLCFLGYTECLHLVAEKIPVINNIAEFASAMDVFVIAAPVTIAFGVLLGIIGSVSSMRKYLRV